MKSRLLLYLLLLPVLLSAQPYAVRQLGIEKGLSNNYVVSIAQDKEGFLWFATEEGLNKFDGTRFITYYKNETKNGYGITGNELRYIGSPFLHRSCRAEIPVKDILSNLADLALVGMILFLWALSCQPHSVHKPLYPLMIDLVAALYQFLIYSSHTVAAFML